jgi:hypothetical protein
MAIKSEELKKGCIAKAANDEPVFVLRAQDKTAPALVRMWANLLEERDPENPKVFEALELAEKMDNWPTRKWPD